MSDPAPSSSRSPRAPRTLPMMLVFIGLFTVILGVGAAVALSAWHLFGAGRECLLWPLLLPAFLFIPSLLFSRQPRCAAVAFLVRNVYRIAALSMALLSFLFLAGAVTWLFGGMAYLLDAEGAESAVKGLAVVLYSLGTGATVYGIGNALFRLRVTRRDVVLANLPAAWHGKTVALVTDLHLGHIYGEAFSKRVVDRLREAAPDLVLIGGDLFDGIARDFDPILAPWRPSSFAPPYGVHYVTGNHEEFHEREYFLNYVRRAGMNILGNTESTGGKIDLDGLQLLGVHDGEAATPESLRAFLLAQRIDRSRAALLLAHIPHRANFPVAEAEGVSLHLSGHTHDGQVWPWKKLASRVHREYTYGLHPAGTGKLQVCTSSGAGTWGPPMRVGTRSEIVVLRLLKG